jgi:putative addiction module killer protein
MPMIDVLRYVTESGREVIREWLDDLHDARAVTKIIMRTDRLADGNFGDCKPLREGVWELRIDYGPDYRVYYARVGQACLLLLCGGDKRKQSSDIERAIEYLKDYKRRIAKP